MELPRLQNNEELLAWVKHWAEEGNDPPLVPATQLRFLAKAYLGLTARIEELVKPVVDGDPSDADNICCEIHDLVTNPDIDGETPASNSTTVRSS